MSSGLYTLNKYMLNKWANIGKKNICLPLEGTTSVETYMHFIEMLLEPQNVRIEKNLEVL